METLKILLPLFGVLVGGLLTGLSSLLKAISERKKLIATALSDLLEVRHHLMGINVVLTEIKRRFNVPNDVSAQLQLIIEQLSPIDEDAHKRYEAAINLLAGVDPFLAFKLRSKNSLPKIIAGINKLAESNGISQTTVSQASDLLRTSLVPKLNEAVIELAGEHSWATKREVKRYITKSNSLPVEAEAFFKKIEAIQDQPQ